MIAMTYHDEFDRRAWLSSPHAHQRQYALAHLLDDRTSPWMSGDILRYARAFGYGCMFKTLYKDLRRLAEEKVITSQIITIDTYYQSTEVVLVSDWRSKLEHAKL